MDPDVDAAWDQEIQDRIRAVDSGAVTGISYQDVMLEAVNRTSIWTAGVDRTISLPIAHGEGRYVIDADGLKRIQDQGQIAFRYVSNPNGSVDDIAGVVNEAGNVLGLMPHPERATKELLGGNDGLLILKALSLVNA